MLVNGHSLFVECYGHKKSPILVLLHHGLGSVSAWRDQIPPLNEAGWRVVAYDRWGYGRSQARPFLSVPGFEPDLADLEELLDTIGVDDVGLIGHSDGGTIALQYASKNPERVSCLVTVAAHIYVEQKMALGIKGIRQSFETDERFRIAFTRVHGEQAENTFWNWYNAWTGLENLDWDMRPLLGSIRCPTLVVQGMEDEHATPKHASEIASGVPNADLWLVPGANHMLPQSTPDIFNNRLVDFLAPIYIRMTSNEMEV